MSAMGQAMKEAGDRNGPVARYVSADYWSLASKTVSAREGKARVRDEIWQELNEEQRAEARRLVAMVREDRRQRANQRRRR